MESSLIRPKERGKILALEDVLRGAFETAHQADFESCRLVHQRHVAGIRCSASQLLLCRLSHGLTVSLHPQN